MQILRIPSSGLCKVCTSQQISSSQNFFLLESGFPGGTCGPILLPSKPTAVVCAPDMCSHAQMHKWPRPKIVSHHRSPPHYGIPMWEMSQQLRGKAKRRNLSLAHKKPRPERWIGELCHFKQACKRTNENTLWERPEAGVAACRKKKERKPCGSYGGGRRASAQERKKHKLPEDAEWLTAGQLWRRVRVDR